MSKNTDKGKTIISLLELESLIKGNSKIQYRLLIILYREVEDFLIFQTYYFLIISFGYIY